MKVHGTEYAEAAGMAEREEKAASTALMIYRGEWKRAIVMVMARNVTMVTVI